MNSQKLELLKDLCEEKLREELDQKTRLILEDILADFKEEIKFRAEALNQEQQDLKAFRREVDKTGAELMELYRQSDTVEEFCKHFTDQEEAMNWWYEFKYKFSK